MKQVDKIKHNYSSSQTVELHPLSILLGFQRSLNSSTVATLSFTRPFGKYFLSKNAKLTRNRFFLLSIDCNEQNTGNEPVLDCWVIVWKYWFNKESLSLLWLSDIRPAGSMSQKLYWPRKTLEIFSSSIEQVSWSFLVMDLGFCRICNAFSFSVDLSDCCRSFRVENNPTIQIYMAHDVLFNNEVHNVIQRKRFFLKFCPHFDEILFLTKKQNELLTF